MDQGLKFALALQNQTLREDPMKNYMPIVMISVLLNLVSGCTTHKHEPAQGPTIINEGKSSDADTREAAREGARQGARDR